MCGGIVGDDIGGRELRGVRMVAELWCVSYWGWVAFHIGGS